MQKYQKLLWQIETECGKWSFEKRLNLDLKKKIEQSGFYKNSESKILTDFWIENEVGNNSFVFEKGKRVFVPALKLATSCELRAASEKSRIVFRDKDEKGDLIESTGLKNFILTQGQKTGLPIYVVDNHNWVFYCWSEYIKSPLRGLGGVVADEGNKPPSPLFKGEQNTLIHIDAHKDEAESSLKTNVMEMDLSTIKDETAKLKVSNYIPAAIQTGLIQPDFLSFTESTDFVDYVRKFELLKKDSQNIILNVDIDIFDSEVSLISLEEKVRLIGYFAGKADLITFATSPGFIDQEFAVEIVKIFLKKL